MEYFKHFKSLLLHEFKLEFRAKSTLFSTLLFVLSSTYLCYLLLGNAINLKVWASLFWIVFLFASFNGVLSNSLQFNRPKMLYLYTLVSPIQYLMSKIISQWAIVLFMSILSLAAWFVFGMTFQNVGLFFLVLAMNALVMASNVSMLSYISVKASGNFALLAILSIPILIPDLLLVGKLSYLILDDFSASLYWKYLAGLGFLSFISIGLSVVLFPYIWTE